MHRLALVATLTLASLGSAAVAQQQAPAQPQDGTAYHHGHHHRMHDPHKQAMMMSKHLNLTPDQTSRLEPILAARQQKMEALKADTSLTPDARRAQFRTIHEETKQQMAGVLTPEQLEQAKAMRHHHGPHGHGAPAEAPPAA